MLPNPDPATDVIVRAMMGSVGGTVSDQVIASLLLDLGNADLDACYALTWPDLATYGFFLNTTFQAFLNDVHSAFTSFTPVPLYTDYFNWYIAPIGVTSNTGPGANNAPPYQQFWVMTARAIVEAGYSDFYCLQAAWAAKCGC
jgi:hypothetical protein